MKMLGRVYGPPMSDCRKSEVKLSYFTDALAVVVKVIAVSA